MGDSEKLGTVLITGGNGIVGSHAVDAFIADGSFSVVATYRRRQQYRNPAADYRVCDITSPEQVKALLDEVKPRVIVHTVSPGPFARSGEQYRVNYVATKHLLDIARQHPSVQAFVYTSSTEAVVLKSGFGSRPETEEEAVLNSLDSGSCAYARTKAAADGLVLSFNTGTIRPHTGDATGSFQGVLLTTCLRVAALYGERDENIIPKMLALVNTFAARVQFGPNKAVHEFVYTESTAQAHVLASKALIESDRRTRDLRVDGEAFFVTDGTPMHFWDFARKVFAEGGDRKLKEQSRAVKIVQIPFALVLFFVGMGELVYKVFTFGYKAPAMELHHFYHMRKGSRFSIDKAQQRLGYRPVCDTDEGIRRTVMWFRKESNSSSLQEPQAK